MDEKLCDERHNDITKRLDQQGHDIIEMKGTVAEYGIMISKLDGTLSRLTTAIWGLMSSVIGGVLIIFATGGFK